MTGVVHGAVLPEHSSSSQTTALDMLRCTSTGVSTPCASLRYRVAPAERIKSSTSVMNAYDTCRVFVQHAAIRVQATDPKGVRLTWVGPKGGTWRTRNSRQSENTMFTPSPSIETFHVCLGTLRLMPGAVLRCPSGLITAADRSFTFWLCWPLRWTCQHAAVPPSQLDQESLR